MIALKLGDMDHSDSENLPRLEKMGQYTCQRTSTGSCFRKAGSLASDEMAVVDAVLDAYGNLSGVQLSNLTHASGTPWYQVYYDEKQDTGDAQIVDDRIKQHFIRLASSKAHGK